MSLCTGFRWLGTKTLRLPIQKAAHTTRFTFLILTAFTLLTTTAPVVHAQNYFDTNGETLGVVSGESYVGTINTDPFTVYTDAATLTDAPVGAHNQSRLEMNGGSIGDNLYLFDSSVVNMRAGEVGGGVFASGGTLNMSGGLVGLIWQDSIFAFGTSTVNITGGDVLGDLVVKEGGTLSVFGTGLSKTLLDPDFHLGVGGDPEDLPYSRYSLSGTLQDGTNLNGQIALVRNDSGSFNLISSAAVPEPGSLAFGVAITGSLLGLHIRKRKA